MGSIWTIILAAGESKRMGSPKMLLPFGGKTVIERVVENVVSSEVDEAIVVLGASGMEIMKRIEKLPVKYCFNSNYREGMLSSVKCGFSFLPDEYEMVMVLPGDYPGIGPGTINMLITRFMDSQKKIVIPLFRGRRGHPILISYELRKEVTRLSPEKGLKGLLEMYSEEVLEIKVDDKAVINDIDTIEDYYNELKQIT